MNGAGECLERGFGVGQAEWEWLRGVDLSAWVY